MSNLADTWPAAPERLPERVSEQAYWEHWYEHPDYNLEWNDGRLEEVPGSDMLTSRVYFWLLELFLHHNPERLAFYSGAPSGTYVPILPQQGVIHSRVFPGFRFRRADLARRSSTAELRADSIYAEFIHPEWQQAEAIAAQVRALAEQAQAKAEQAQAQTEQAQAKAEQAQAQTEQAQAKADQAQAQAERERRGREAAEALAHHERRRREAAEARLAEFEARLARTPREP